MALSVGFSDVKTYTNRDKAQGPTGEMTGDNLSTSHLQYSVISKKWIPSSINNNLTKPLSSLTINPVFHI